MVTDHTGLCPLSVWVKAKFWRLYVIITLGILSVSTSDPSYLAPGGETQLYQAHPTTRNIESLMAKIDEIVPAAHSRALSLPWPGTDISNPHLSSQPVTRTGLYRSVGKRLLDLVIVVLAAPFVAVLVGLFALVVMMDGGSPFYRQARVGQNGRIFRMWKLRSMAVDAEARLESVLAADPDLRREWDHSQKLRNDPRITKVGRFIRKASIDELPQLLNVIAGEMSLVGPRPMMPEQQALYKGESYYRLRPGLTGMWQVSQRNLSSFADRVHFDDDYDAKLSLWTDVKLLMSTLRVILRGTGC